MEECSDGRANGSSANRCSDYLMSEDLPESLQLDPDSRDRLTSRAGSRTADGPYLEAAEEEGE